MGWTVEFLDADVRAALEAMPKDIVARFLRITRLIESEGLPKMREPYVKHLEGPVWEMRMKGKDGIARAAYVAGAGRRVVVVYAFRRRRKRRRGRNSPTEGEGSQMTRKFIPVEE